MPLFAERDIEKDILRMCAARKHKGAHELEMLRVVNSMNWIEAKYEKPLEGCGDANGLVNEMCRGEMWKAIFRLFWAGYTPAEISKSLKMPYSTVYYYCKKFKNRQKPRPTSRDRWKLDEEKKIKRIKEPYKDRKARLETKKILLSAAEEKRKRRMERNRQLISQAAT